MKFLKQLPKSIWLMFSVLFFVVSLYGLISMSELQTHASESGERLGTDLGTAAGRAAGSFDGITKGNAAGFRDGKEEGLSAQDTAGVIKDIKEIGELEVLAATTSIENVNKVGDDYAALYLLRGEVVFTVDLGQAVFDSETFSILIPEPQAVCHIDPSEIVKVAEYQKHFFSGSTEDGFTEYMNSLKSIGNVHEENISNYEYLLDSAKEAAIRQVGSLAENIRMKEGKISVCFLEKQS